MEQRHHDQSTSARATIAPHHSNRLVTRIILIAGDTAMFIIFAAVGRMSHAEPAGLAALDQVLQTAIPFIAGWFITAPFVGAYRLQPAHPHSKQTAPHPPGESTPYATPQQILKRTAIAWLCAWPVGLLFRALLLWRPIPLTFALITGVTNLLLLGSWRMLFAVWQSQRSRTTQAGNAE